MAQTTQQELNNIKSDLRAIIAQISSVSDDINNNQGIEIEKCAQSLKTVAQQYRRILSKLEQINLNDEENASGGGRF